MSPLLSPFPTPCAQVTGDIASFSHFTTDQIGGLRRDCEVELRGVLSEHYPPSSEGQNAPSDETGQPCWTPTVTSEPP